MSKDGARVDSAARRPHGDDAGPRARLLVIQPDLAGPLDQFADWLFEAGVETRVVRPFRGEAVPRHLAEDGLLVLGGKMSANDDDRHPWLVEVRQLLLEAVDLARPTLGVCLGGQLLARATGGSVAPGDRGIEAGVVRVVWTAQAESDPLVAALPQPFLSVVMHEDMIDKLPDGAVCLGRSDQYQHQAFRVGRQAWGVQFHPEASPASYRGWVAAFEDDGTLDQEGLHAGLDDFEGLGAEIRTGPAELARRFARIVSDSAQWRRRGAAVGRSPEAAAADLR